MKQGKHIAPNAIAKYEKSACESSQCEIAHFYKHLFTYRNADFLPALRNLFIDTNSAAFLPRKALFMHPNGRFTIPVSFTPKYLKFIEKHSVDANTGEHLGSEVIETDSERGKRGKRINKLRLFDATYLPLKRARKLSLLFITLTHASHSSISISAFFDALKKRARRRGVHVYGYIWVSEVSERLHWHYHAIVAVSRLSGKLPVWLHAETLWGERTRVQFVKGTATSHYLSKYMGKASGVVQGVRSMGASLKFNKPTP
jgi:hypothetical protein